MAGAQLETFLRRMRRKLGSQKTQGTSDAVLLARFVQQRDEEAFELLVWRHGLMVLNVCRRVLRHEHDAEDAFQATFLALARKAGTIGKRESVGSWLYKVAYRIALRGNRAVHLRALSEKPLPDPSSREPISDHLHLELRLAIDEEIRRLPERYRTALVLCHLEGRTIEAAARSLNCPPGTVGTWLARARTLLRRRLARRGFDGSDLAGARNIVAVLSAALVHSTVQAAVFGTAEQAVAAGIISSTVAAMTKGALQAMSFTRSAVITGMILALGLIGGGGALLVHGVLAAEPEKTASAAASQRPATENNKPTAVMLRWRFQKGKPFYQVFTTETSQQMKVMSNDVNQKQKQTFYLQWTPKEEANGKWILSQKILGMKLDMDIGDTPIKYDSTTVKQPPSPSHEFFKALIGEELEFQLDAGTLEVLRIDGRKELANKLKEAHRGMTSLIDMFLSEAALKEMADSSFGALMGPARPGDSWTKRRPVIDLGPIGKSQSTLRYTYEGKKDKLDKVTVKITMKYLYPDKPEGVGGLPFHIRKSNIRGNGLGFLYFDCAKSRLDSSLISTTLAGTMDLEIGGQETQVDYLQTQQTTVRTMDANPLAAAPPQKENEPLRKENERLRQENEQLRRRLQAVSEALHRDNVSKK